MDALLIFCMIVAIVCTILQYVRRNIAVQLFALIGGVGGIALSVIEFGNGSFNSESLTIIILMMLLAVGMTAANLLGGLDA